MKLNVLFLIITTLGFSVETHSQNQKIRESALNEIGLDIEILWEKYKAVGLKIKNISGWNQANKNNTTLNQLGSKEDILADAKIKSDLIILRPNTPFTVGKCYVLSINGKIINFIIKEKDQPRSQVTEFYPRNDKIPSNILKIRISFSESMSPNPKDYIKVYKNGSKTPTYPFLDFGEEQWNGNQTELTLSFDHRILENGELAKINKVTNLNVGDKIEIIVSSEWPDINGNILGKNYRYQFAIVEPDQVKPDPQDWDIYSPVAGTIKPLSILLKEEFDTKLLRQYIKIQINGDIIKGHLVTKKDGLAIFFYPQEKWEKSQYQISIDPKLEDLAGNSLIHLFDKDLNNNKEKDKVQTSLTFMALTY